MKLNFLFRNKFIFWNFVALMVVKAVFSYSGYQLATLFKGIEVFTKEEIVIKTNQSRSGLGLDILAESQALDLAAAQKLQDMISSQYFAHFSPQGVPPWHWIETNQYDYSYAGENLAIGFFSADETVTAWRESPSHRENLLNPKYREIGVAVAPANIQGDEGILVVQLFATPQPPKTQIAVNKPAPTLAPSPAKSPPASPTLTPTVTPSPTPAVLGQTKILPPERTVYASDKQVNLNTPTTAPSINKTARSLNTVFIVYALLIFGASLLVLLAQTVSRDLLLKSALHLAVVILAILLPVLQITHRALIF